ncbi:MAG: HAMP domain-containing protein [Betaproteobacteria bacterium]|nr:HAMP domain-containing protein [Betaproteobacteria bacterium]
MKLWPQSLFARTALVMVAVLVVSQLVSVMLFRYYSQQPRFNLIAAGYLSHLKTIRAAFETLPPEKHRDFIQRLREERGIRVIPSARLDADSDDRLDPAPNLPAIRNARERLREQFGERADLFQVRRPPRAGQDGPEPKNEGKGPPSPPLITRLPVGESHVWVVFPQSRIVEADYSMAWLGWGVVGGVLALAAALFVVRRLNRPLKALAQSATEIGAGRHPPPVTEMGPEEVKSVAVAFNRMREGLEKNERERTTFLAGVSHDLRTPLTRLRLGMEMLPMDEAARRDLEGDIADINAVIDQFMDYARSEAAEAPESVDLNTLVHAAAERGRRMGMIIDTHLETHATLRLRPQSIARLLNNLIDNARKHAGTPVDIRVAHGRDVTTLTVEDRGPGIPLDQAERLKQPFTRLDSARSGSSGAGLGLAIADRIATLHGARFSLLPRMGGGTVAEVAFPNAPTA